MGTAYISILKIISQYSLSYADSVQKDIIRQTKPFDQLVLFNMGRACITKAIFALISTAGGPFACILL